MDTPANSATGSSSANAPESARLNREPSTASTIKPESTSEPSQPSQPSQPPTQASTASSSPLNSRDSSPSRPLARSNSNNKPSTAPTLAPRSRRASAQDPSPSRVSTATAHTASSAGKISGGPIPKLNPVTTDGIARAAVPHKSPITAEHLKESPRWPVSPRLRSPPPNRPNLPPPPRKEPEVPPIHVQRSSPQLPQEPFESTQSDTDADEALVQAGLRPAPRGASGSASAITLETVQEASPMASPQGRESMLEKLEDCAASEAGSQIDLLELSVPKAHKPVSTTSNHDSGSDSGSVKADRRPAMTSVPPALASRQSSASVATNKTKPSEASLHHMTVETETVASVPQVSLAPAGSKEAANGTLRAKPSSETIRPKKEKRKTRKQPNIGSGTGETAYFPSAVPAQRLRHHQSIRSVSSMTDALVSPTRPCGDSVHHDDPPSPRRSSTPAIRSGRNTMGLLLTKARTASSKADIFEAKIATAVDEADSSDSEETFVYDSNPPDVADRPRRFHSRTPSATSMVSQVDRNGLRSISNIMDAGASAAKKNMKFVNTFSSSGTESQLPEDESKGTVRATTGSSRATSRAHHHHFGRWGRNGTNGHMSLFDAEAPFHVNVTSAPRTKFATANSRQSSGPPSPRFVNAGRLAATGKRGVHSASYDMDETTGADDERTPLIQGSVRSGRSGRNRRQPVSLRSLENQSYHRNPTMLNRFASCLVLTVMLLLVVSGAIGFMFATSQPLTDVELVSINTVIASETELMFDLSVSAHNPNVVVVVVDQADIEVFAKSPHAATASRWFRHEHKDGQNSDGTWGDEKDPVDDRSPNMRLGTIGQLDSPLSFEGSFFNQGVSASTGEVRLRAPGNGTEDGTSRWENIIQEDFELIIKGVLKYSLPLSQRIRSVTISGRTTVKPNSADNPSLKPNETELVTFVS